MLRVPFFLWVGLRNFTKGGYERAARSFDPSIKERDLTGKTAMVTGANQGIGLQISLDLASRGSSLYMVCRSEQRGIEAVERVRTETGNSDVHLCLADISNLADIRKLATEYISSGRPLHFLINNAGVMVHENRLSAEGHDINFATNTLGTYALTKALEPVLRRSAPSRVVFVSSGGALTEHLEVNDLEGDQLKGNKDRGQVQYSRDKRRQIALAERLARDWSGAGIGVYSMHPGWVETEGVKSSIPGFYNTFKGKMRTLSQGADTIVWLCAEDSDKLVSGAFYLDRRPQAKHLPLSGTKYSEECVDTLIEKLDSMAETGLKDSLAQ